MTVRMVSGGRMSTPKVVTTILSAADSLGVLVGWLAGVCLASLVLLITAEIFLASASRLVPWLPANISFAWEYSAYLMGVAFLLGTAFTLHAGAHIRMTMAVSHLPPFGRRLFETASSLIGCGVTWFLAWSLAGFTVTSWTSSQVSAASFTPLWIPQAALAFGSVTLAIQMTARLVRCLFGLPLQDENLKATGPVE